MKQPGKRAQRYTDSAEYRADAARLEAAWEQLRHLEILRIGPGDGLRRAMRTLESDRVERVEEGIAHVVADALEGGAGPEEALMALLRCVRVFGSSLRGSEPYPASEALVRANEVFLLLRDMKADSGAMIYLLAFTAIFILLGVEARGEEKRDG